MPDLAIPDLAGHRLEPSGAPARFVTASLLKGLYYYRRTALFVLAGVLAFGVLVALLAPARYRSEAKLLALTSDYYDVRSESSDSKAEPFKPEEVVNLEMQLLSSTDLHSAALRRMSGAPTGAIALERARERFTKALKVTKASDANVIELVFADPDPLRADAALARLIEVYQQSRARLLLSGQAAQLEQQRNAAQNDLATTVDALRAFQAEHGIADIDAQIAGAITLDTTLRERLADSEAGLSGARGGLARLRATARQVPSTIEIFRDDTEATTGIADMQNQILQLAGKRADLAGRYMPGSPLIVQVDKQIAALRQAVSQQTGQLQAARRTGRNTAYDAAIGQIRDGDAATASEAAKRARLGQDIGASDTRLRALNGLAATIADLKLQRDVAQERFRMLARQLDQARARASEARAGGSNVRVIQAPNVPTARSNPAWLIIAAAIAAALVLAAVVLVLRALGRKAMLDDAEAAAAAQAPVLADLRAPPATGNCGLARQLAAGHAPGGDLADERGRLVAVLASSAEDLDQGCRALVRELDCGEGRVGMATIGLARDGFDPDRLIAGLPADAAVAIGDQAWAIDAAGIAQIDALRDRHRWVLLVLPPIAGDDPQSMAARSRAQIAARADQVLLLARTEHTARNAAEGLALLLERCGRPISGVILTGRRIAWPRFLRV